MTNEIELLKKIEELTETDEMLILSLLYPALKSEDVIDFVLNKNTQEKK